MDQNQKGQKVGPDGLTKKERRALKVKAANKKVDTQILVNNLSASQCVKKEESKEAEANCLTRTNNTVTPATALSKAELKAQRRALQEAQRLAKANSKSNFSEGGKELQPVPLNNKENNNETNKGALQAQQRIIQQSQKLKVNLKSEKIKTPEKSEQKKLQIKRAPQKKVIKSRKEFHKVSLFDHLYLQNGDMCNKNNLDFKYVHAAFFKLGAQYSSKTILGSNARCLALLSALKCLINDFETPPKEELCRSLESAIESSVSYLRYCRTMAVSMANALKYFKLYLIQIDTNLPDNEKKEKLIEYIDTYISDEIKKAGIAITLRVKEKICNGDFILTFGCSSLIKQILLEAHRDDKNFKVVVVDARPLLEGREMLRTLASNGISCTYVLINAVSYIMSRVTKVLLGAHALLANGYVMSRTGTAQVALIANAYNKPVLVCCEMYKFSERVQTDSFVYNELGDPDKLVIVDTKEENNCLANWRNNTYLTPLNLMYDVTPPDFVTAVVTELAFLPCTSVPVILRIRPTEMNK